MRLTRLRRPLHISLFGPKKGNGRKQLRAEGRKSYHMICSTLMVLVLPL